VHYLINAVIFHCVSHLCTTSCVSALGSGGLPQLSPVSMLDSIPPPELNLSQNILPSYSAGMSISSVGAVRSKTKVPYQLHFIWQGDERTAARWPSDLLDTDEPGVGMYVMVEGKPVYRLRERQCIYRM